MDESIEYGREVLRLEAAAIDMQRELLGPSFVEAVGLVLACSGDVVLTGMGKSGIIAQKISATLASTGTRSFFLHPAEAIHGDLGRLDADDLVIALSNSGSSEEIRNLIPAIKRIGATLIGITAKEDSSLGRHSDCLLLLPGAPEACPVGLAPTTSTTVQLAVGDALAMTVAKRRNFTREEYARYHPGGALGRSLLRVHEVMVHKEAVPPAQLGASTRKALIDAGGLGRRPGALPIVDSDGKLAGLLTDGDVRRHVLVDPNFIEKPIDEVMTRNPISVKGDDLAASAWRVMRERNFDELPVIDSDGSYQGLLDVQDLLKAGFEEGEKS
ncbi:MAG: KpsF/GutQ family sugar-phosphate isomerase [Planctomycetota bacterium]|jgi:arabinose-5-phosphate isomerase